MDVPTQDQNQMAGALMLVAASVLAAVVARVLLAGGGHVKCSICLENVESQKMFKLEKCRHRFCTSCMQKHVEIKVRGGVLPRCPHLGCITEISIDASRNLLPPKLHGLMYQLVRESTTPSKVYCPNPKCSYLMSKPMVLATRDTSRMELNMRQCVSCRSLFCVSCQVLWHNNMSCDAYKMWELDSGSPDGQLKLLAIKKKWRQCPMCFHMVDRAYGCRHIICRCGHAFCYNCGSQYSTCSCWW